MRVNIYSQEITSDVALIKKQGGDGSTYSAVSLFLHSSNMLHQPPEHQGSDDDRSAVTLWLPKSPERREELAKTLEKMATLVREAPAEIPTYDETNIRRIRNAKTLTDLIDEIVSITPTAREVLWLASARLIEPDNLLGIFWRRDILEKMDTRFIFEMLKALREQSATAEWFTRIQSNKWFKDLVIKVNQGKDQGKDRTNGIV